MAQEVLLSEFDYFSPPQVLAQITSEYYEAIPPAHAVGGGTIEFDVKGEPRVYRDLSNSFLEVKCKVTNADGTDLANNAAVAPVNDLLHSMFSSVGIIMCGKPITEKSTHYPYRAFIESLLTYPTEVLRTRGKLQGWQLDESAESMDRLLLNVANAVNPNPAFVQRAATIAGSRPLTLVGRIHADLFHQPLDIPPECDLHISLTPAESKFALQAAVNSTFKLTILSATLHVLSKVGSPEFLAAHQHMLQSQNYRIPLNTVNLRAYGIGQGLTSYTIPDPFKSKLPHRIVLGLVSQARSSGAYELNPFKFENFGLTSVEVKVGGECVPRDGLEMNYATGDYARAYINTLGALGMDIGDRALAVAPDLWASAYNLYAFKLTPGPCDQGNIETVQTGAVTITLTFANGLAAPVTAFLYSETNGLLQINVLNDVVLS